MAKDVEIRINGPFVVAYIPVDNSVQASQMADQLDKMESFTVKQRSFFKGKAVISGVKRRGFQADDMVNTIEELRNGSAQVN